MILFAGHEDKGFFIKEIAEKRGLGSARIEERQHLPDQAADLLQFKEKASWIIYEIEQYIDDPGVLTEWILKIQNALPVKSCIFAPGYSPQSNVIQMLYQQGIQNFIFSIYLSEQKEDLERCLDGYYETFGYESKGICFENPETEEQESEETPESSGQMIGVAGAVARMGTTTQAIQIVKYLHFQGHHAAYIQMNSHHFVEDLAAAYSEAKQDEESGMVSYQGVDLYYRLDKLQEILKKDYEYFVFDFGVWKDLGFNKISFLEKSVQIFVVGSNPSEFQATYEVIQSNFYSDNFYIYSFTPVSEQKDLLELMEEKAAVTFFAEEVRDPFCFSGNLEMYQEIIPVENKSPEKNEKKRHFWNRKRR